MQLGPAGSYRIKESCSGPKETVQDGHEQTLVHGGLSMHVVVHGLLPSRTGIHAHVILPVDALTRAHVKACLHTNQWARVPVPRSGGTCKTDA